MKTNKKEFTYCGKKLELLADSVQMNQMMIDKIHTSINILGIIIAGMGFAMLLMILYS